MCGCCGARPRGLWVRGTDGVLVAAETRGTGRAARDGASQRGCSGAGSPGDNCPSPGGGSPPPPPFSPGGTEPLPGSPPSHRPISPPRVPVCPPLLQPPSGPGVPRSPRCPILPFPCRSRGGPLPSGPPGTPVSPPSPSVSPLRAVSPPVFPLVPASPSPAPLWPPPPKPSDPRHTAAPDHAPFLAPPPHLRQSDRTVPNRSPPSPPVSQRSAPHPGAPPAARAAAGSHVREGGAAPAQCDGRRRQ